MQICAGSPEALLRGKTSLVTHHHAPNCKLTHSSPASAIPGTMSFFHTHHWMQPNLLGKARSCSRCLFFTKVLGFIKVVWAKPRQYFHQYWEHLHSGECKTRQVGSYGSHRRANGWGQTSTPCTALGLHWFEWCQVNLSEVQSVIQTLCYWGEGRQAPFPQSVFSSTIWKYSPE